MKCGFCETETPNGQAFCSPDCESAYSNTAGDHCELCGEYEDECICTDDPRFTTGERMQQAADEDREPSQANEDVRSGGFAPNH